MKATCPNDPSHNTFATCATVLEDWEVDERGEFLARIDFVEVVHEPHPNNCWTCRECGAEAIVTRDDGDDDDEATP